jgi:hypothetical protein
MAKQMMKKINSWKEKLNYLFMLMKGLNQCCESIQFPMLKTRVQGEVFVTQTQAHVLLLELTHKLNVGNNFLLNLNLKLEP